jgi:predicted peroxiredoxin
MDKITYPAKEIPVIREVDVLVAGGGYAGFGAAMAAAKAGAKTLLVEQQSCLGGLVTMGFVALTFSYIEGIGVDLFAELKKEEAVVGRFVDPEKTKRVLERMLLEAGVEILYCTTITDALVENNTITGAVVFNKSGFGAIKAKRVIDASGDGDVAAFAGVPFEVGSPEHNGYNQSASLVCRVGNVNYKKYMSSGKRFEGDTLLRFVQEKVEEAVANGDFPYMIDKRFNWIVKIPGRDDERQELVICYAHSRNCRCLDAFDITRMYIEGRIQNELLIKFLQKYIPGFENAWLIDTAPLLGVRESRRIMCEYKVTGQDLIENRRFPDAVMRDMHALDAHHPTEPGHIKYVLYPDGKGGMEKRYVMPGSFREIPYRALVTQKIDNLLIAGRNISADFMGQSGTRLVMACLNMGQAAGSAAALSIKDNVTPRNLDIQKLRRHLMDLGVTLDSNPEFGTDHVDPNAKVTKDDIITPEEGGKYHPHAVTLKNKSIPTVKENIDEKIAKRKTAISKEDAHSREAYTETGGDVGTNLE